MLAMERKWNWKALLFCHLLIAFLLTSFYWPVTRVLWESLDVAFFRFINESVRDSKLWQTFWAMANHKKADWLEDVCIFLFFLSWIRSKPAGERARATAQFLFCVLYATFTILVVNHLIFRVLVDVYRDCPTLVLENTVRISKNIRWMSIKDTSTQCFPADHATTALLFAFCYAYFAGKKRAFLGALYAAFLCMPRMITGAHWLSDIIVGSGSIILLFLSWAFFTPVHIFFTDRIEKVVYFFRKKQPV